MTDTKSVPLHLDPEKLCTNAKVVADSITPWGDRLTTIQVTLHRWVLSEFNTHRMFSRNSASSRAIPFKKQVERIVSSPADPVVWAGEKPGMQGGDELGEGDLRKAQKEWIAAREAALFHATMVSVAGLHKSLVNRLLEPFMWHTIIVTATEWQNFFKLRCSPLAQPEIRVAAEMMREVYEDSKPDELLPGQWHLPYISDEDRAWADEYAFVQSGPSRNIELVKARTADALRRISVARCARVSHLTFDGERDLGEDLDLFGRLSTADPMHASPLEHVATPAVWNRQEIELMQLAPLGELVGSGKTIEVPKVGNFLGYYQFRHAVEAAA